MSLKTIFSLVWNGTKKSICHGLGSSHILMFMDCLIKMKIFSNFQTLIGTFIWLYAAISYGHMVFYNIIFLFWIFSKISYDGNKTYTSKSAFLNFGSYTVENRDRVKVIDGTHGVPISTQVSVVRFDQYWGSTQRGQNDWLPPHPQITGHYSLRLLLSNRSQSFFLQ